MGSIEVAKHELFSEGEKVSHWAFWRTSLIFEHFYCTARITNLVCMKILESIHLWILRLRLEKISIWFYFSKFIMNSPMSKNKEWNVHEYKKNNNCPKIFIAEKIWNKISRSIMIQMRRKKTSKELHIYTLFVSLSFRAKMY